MIRDAAYHVDHNEGTTKKQVAWQAKELIYLHRKEHQGSRELAGRL
jgi:hypothetical protein